MLVVLLALLIVLWTLAIFWFDNVPFAILDPTAHGAIEGARSLALLFGALALFLFPDTGAGDRIRWVAFGLVVLAIGGIGFSYVFTTFAETYSANERIFASITVRTIATTLMVVGLATVTCPRLTPIRFLVGMPAVIGLAVIVVFVPGLQPTLTEASLIDLLRAPQATVLVGLTIWHWLLSAIPLALILYIVLRLLRPPAGGRIRNWLLMAMVLFAGSHLHNMIWPSIYSPVATTADVLRIGFAAMVLFGTFVELGEVAQERAARLAEEREYARRLVELQTLRADFTRMVAHELSNPLAAIRRYSEVLGNGALGSERQTELLAGIQQEVDLLRNLIADVHNAAMVEHDTFTVRQRPVPLQVMLSEAIAFAQTLPNVKTRLEANLEPVLVSADPERIGQVMHNLLTNAAKYSSPGALVEILATQESGQVHIAVKDDGPGIHPDDQVRIFEKFGRARTLDGREQPGLGLGLYVSQRILRLHGSGLRVVSAPGEGTTFSFELKIARQATSPSPVQD
jgi:signal transduction histidine kinase